VVVVDVDLHDEGAVVAVGVEARHESGAALALRRHALLPVGAVATVAALCQGTKGLALRIPPPQRPVRSGRYRRSKAGGGKVTMDGGDETSQKGECQKAHKRGKAVHPR
jgi:hypothetical protein